MGRGSLWGFFGYFGGVVRRCAKLSPWVLRIYDGGGQNVWRARGANGRRSWFVIGVKRSQAVNERANRLDRKEGERLLLLHLQV